MLYWNQHSHNSRGQIQDYLALRHLRPQERARVLEGLRLTGEATDVLADLGHRGPNDVIISQDRGSGEEL